MGIARHPHKLTPETQQKIVGSIRAGNSKTFAAQAGGISRALFYHWLKRGAAGEEPYLSFELAVDEAEGKKVERVSSVIMNAIHSGDAKLGLEYLKTYHSRDFGPKVTLAHEEVHEEPPLDLAQHVVGQALAGPTPTDRRLKNEITGEDGCPHCSAGITLDDLGLWVCSACGWTKRILVEAEAED